MKRQEINLSIEQEEAVEMCLDALNRIFSVTGRAGTGKTSVLGIAYEETVQQVGAGKVVLCAPTGRAAKRIYELTGIRAKTIHKLLEFPQPDDEDEDGNPLPPDPRRNRERPLYERVVYVDESSMLSQQLYEQLMACKVISAKAGARALKVSSVVLSPPPRSTYGLYLDLNSPPVQPPVDTYPFAPRNAPRGLGNGGMIAVFIKPSKPLSTSSPIVP